ncbi:MAG TPA: HEAT repeat domain-containing protein [Coleofasciculaceae cyanobacterium]|jgi:HEAT repeat protein
MFDESDRSTLPSAALSTALAHLKLGDFQRRWDMAKTIPDFGEAAIAPLVSLLQAEAEEDWELTWFIARILGSLKHPEAMTALVDLIRTTASEDVAAMATAALTQMGTEAIAPLQTLLSQPSTYGLGVQALAQIRHSDVVPSLLEAMQHESVALRVAAIDALSHFQHPQISAALLKALHDPAAKVRQSAVTTLGLQAALYEHPEELTDRLKPLLWDLNLEVCQQSAIALGRIGQPAVAALFEVLRSPHALPLQIEAVRALGRIGTPDALDRLQEFLNLQRDLLICQESLTVLGRVESAEAKRQATQILLDLLQSDHAIAQTDRGKQAIALSLGQLKQPQALEALIQLLADPSASVRLHAIAALKQLDTLGVLHLNHQIFRSVKQLEPQTTQEILRTIAAQNNLDADLQKGVAIALQEWGSSVG